MLLDKAHAIMRVILAYVKMQALNLGNMSRRM